MRGLLDRVAAGSIGRHSDPLASITSHLRVLLNTRRGESPSAPQFGIPDFTELVHAFPHSVPMLQRAVQATVLEFEPRLRNVQVRHVPDADALVVRFEITAQLVQQNGSRVLRFRTEVAPGGRVTLS